QQVGGDVGAFTVDPVVQAVGFSSATEQVDVKLVDSLCAAFASEQGFVLGLVINDVLANLGQSDGACVNFSGPVIQTFCVSSTAEKTNVNLLQLGFGTHMEISISCLRRIDICKRPD